MLGKEGRKLLLEFIFWFIVLLAFNQFAFYYDRISLQFRKPNTHFVHSLAWGWFRSNILGKSLLEAIILILLSRLLRFLLNKIK